MDLNDGNFTLKSLAATDLDRYIDDLVEIFYSTVNSNAAIGYLSPLSTDEATDFWIKNIKPSLISGERILFAASLGQLIVGVVQLIVQMPPNQPHRVELAKLMVHPEYRRKGLASMLVTEAETYAINAGKSLMTFDTRTGDSSENFYRSQGFKTAGIIPQFALDPDGKNYHGTTLMYKQLSHHEQISD